MKSIFAWTNRFWYLNYHLVIKLGFDTDFNSFYTNCCINFFCQSRVFILTIAFSRVASPLTGGEVLKLKEFIKDDYTLTFFINNYTLEINFYGFVAYIYFTILFKDFTCPVTGWYSRCCFAFRTGINYICI